MERWEGRPMMLRVSEQKNQWLTQPKKPVSSTPRAKKIIHLICTGLGFLSEILQEFILFYLYSLFALDWRSVISLNKYVDTAGAYINCPCPSVPRIVPSTPHCWCLIPNLTKTHTHSPSDMLVALDISTSRWRCRGFFYMYIQYIMYKCTLSADRWHHVALERF